MRQLLQNKWFYILIAALVVGWWWMGRDAANKGPAITAVRVTVAPVTRQDVPMQVQLVGNVVPYETVVIKSRLDSQVVNVLFHDGDDVKEGQVLFELDDRAIKAQIQQLAAATEKEKAQSINTRLQYERAEKLVKNNIVSQSQVDDARAAYEAQVAQVNAAQANLNNTKVLLTYTTITSPINGRTGTISVTRGNTVKANDTQALVTINQVTPIRVQFSIPQRYYEQVKAAMAAGALSVQARHNESPDALTGALEYVDNTIDPSTGTFAARAKFSNEDEKLWPGMFVNISLELGTQKNVMTIPAVAVQGDEGNRFVFTVDAATKKAVRKPVEVSQNTGDVVIVGKGLEDNDQVITDGILRVTDGATVETAPTQKPADAASH